MKKKETIVVNGVEYQINNDHTNSVFIQNQINKANNVPKIPTKDVTGEVVLKAANNSKSKNQKLIVNSNQKDNWFIDNITNVKNVDIIRPIRSSQDDLRASKKVVKKTVNNKKISLLFRIKDKIRNMFGKKK